MGKILGLFIKATFSEKITNVRKSLEDVIPSPGPMLSSWRYNGEQISIAYKDENVTEMRITRF